MNGPTNRTTNGATNGVLSDPVEDGAANFWTMINLDDCIKRIQTNSEHNRSGNS